MNPQEQFAEAESLEARGLTEDDLLVDVKVLSSAEMAALMGEPPPDDWGR